MLIRCPSCGQRSPGGAANCVDCGSALHVLAPAARHPIASAAGPTARLSAGEQAWAPGESIAARALPVAGLLFTVVFSLGLASYLATGWSHPLGFWPMGVLVAGALLAQQAWLHGRLWRGMCGMALWGGLIWLLAAHLEVPWAGVLLAGWALFRPIEYLRRGGPSPLTIVPDEPRTIEDQARALGDGR